MQYLVLDICNLVCSKMSMQSSSCTSFKPGAVGVADALRIFLPDCYLNVVIVFACGRLTVPHFS